MGLGLCTSRGKGGVFRPSTRKPKHWLVLVWMTKKEPVSGLPAARMAEDTDGCIALHWMS